MAVLVEDSMCLMFFLFRPQTIWCRDSSNLTASTILPSYGAVSIGLDLDKA